MRLQLALNVSNLDEAVRYYKTLFNTEPHKRRSGYANFAIDQPPLKLVLFENPQASERLNHLGVEVFDDAEIDAASKRLSQGGILDRVQSETVCCHAAQNKIWSKEYQGLSWEWYRILDDNPSTATASEDGVCCGQDVGATETCCS
ncbi:MAG: ArsI/CadI family heavy metal resistance metalloenzyme [Geminicoccaceae bacterium]